MIAVIAASAMIALTGGFPARAVLASLRDTFTTTASLSDRCRRAIHGPAAPFSSFPAGESWLSSLRSALWIARAGKPPVCWLIIVLPI
ncbi:hypothetical protein JOE09_001435 [Pantoea coffeiphila]|nr:hypothetical protein [Pantoea coffeiphila]